MKWLLHCLYILNGNYDFSESSLQRLTNACLCIPSAGVKNMGPHARPPSYFFLLVLFFCFFPFLSSFCPPSFLPSLLSTSFPSFLLSFSFHFLLVLETRSHCVSWVTWSLLYKPGCPQTHLPLPPESGD